MLHVIAEHELSVAVIADQPESRTEPHESFAVLRDGVCLFAGHSLDVLPSGLARNQQKEAAEKE